MARLTGLDAGAFPPPAPSPQPVSETGRYFCRRCAIQSTTTTHIRAIALADGEITLRSRHPRPTPAPGESLIRPTRLGISGIDREVCRGLAGFGGVLGHEFVGIVEAVEGDDSRRLQGRRVVGSPIIACGSCNLCQSGLSVHCRDRRIIGMTSRDGCFADRLTMPTANLVPVPDAVDDDHAVFAVPLSSAIQAARQFTIEGKPYITVLGDGPLGMLMVQVMAKLNASVRLVGRYTEKLSICEKWGIKHRHVDDIGRRADQDIVVDCTGSRSGLELSMKLVRPRGRIVLKSIIAPGTKPDLPLDLSPLVLHEIGVVGSGFGPIHEAVNMLASGGVDVVSLISRRANLADGLAAIKASAKPGIIKVVMDL